MTSIYKLKQIEYSKGAEISLNNAKSHYSIAEKAAEVGEYGIASSLLVTSVEELVKASILKIKSIDNSIKIENLDDYFRKHYVKHQSITNLLSASFYINFEKFQENPEQETSKILETENSKISEDKGMLLLMIAVVALIIIVCLYFKYQEKHQDENEEETVLDSLDDIRMKGLYLGYNEKNRKWINPSEIFDQQSYNELKYSTDLAFSSLEDSLFSGRINKSNIHKFIELIKDPKIFTTQIANKKNIC